MGHSINLCNPYNIAVNGLVSPTRLDSFVALISSRIESQSRDSNTRPVASYTNNTNEKISKTVKC